MARRAGRLGGVAGIVALRDRIDQWRASGRPGKRMPEKLWQSAVALGREHGASAVSGELGVNYGRLRRRMSAEQGVSARPDTAGEQATGAHFVELDVGGMLGGPVGDGQRSELELERADGTRLRVRLGAGERLDLGAAVAAFVGGAVRR